MMHSKVTSVEDPSSSANTTYIEEWREEPGISSSPNLPTTQKLESPYSDDPALISLDSDRSSSPFLPAYPDPEIPLAPYRLLPHLSSQLASTPPNQYLSPYHLLSHSANRVYLSPPNNSPCSSHVGPLPSAMGPVQHPNVVRRGLPERVPSISSLAMNQMASIAIGATRQKAGIDDAEALRMWRLWMDLVPGHEFIVRDHYILTKWTAALWC